MNQEYKFTSMLSKIMDLLLINLLFIITSLPCITLGASITALFSVAMKLVRNEESYVTKDYFHAFCKNFKHATAAFLFFAILIALFLFNILIALRNPTGFLSILGCLSLMFEILLGIGFLYYFPILARFEFTPMQVLAHIPHMIANNPGLFLLLAALNFPILFLCFYSVYTLLFIIIAALLIGCSGFVYIESFLFCRIFAPYEKA